MTEHQAVRPLDVLRRGDSVASVDAVAVELPLEVRARDAGITLLGFVRNGGFNVYSHPERLAGRLSFHSATT